MNPDYKKLMIDAIYNQDIDAVARLIKIPEVQSLLDEHKILEVAAINGGLAILQLIAPFVSYNHCLSALGVASSHDKPHCVKFLLSLFEPQHINKNRMTATEALILATENNCPECVELLIPVSDCTLGDNRALRSAAYYGNEQCLKLLIPFSDRRNYNSALENAAKNGHSSCVELLTRICDVTAKNCQALWLAAKYGNRECVELLAPFGDANAILKSLIAEYPDDPKRWEHLQEAVNQLQRQRIVDEIDHAENPWSRARKI